MIANERQRTRYRLELLALLKEALPFTMQLVELLGGVTDAGHKTTAAECMTELEALKQKRFIAIGKDATNGTIATFKLTEKGREELARNNL